MGLAARKKWGLFNPNYSCAAARVAIESNNVTPQFVRVFESLSIITQLVDYLYIHSFPLSLIVYLVTKGANNALGPWKDGSLWETAYTRLRSHQTRNNTIYTQKEDKNNKRLIQYQNF